MQYLKNELRYEVHFLYMGIKSTGPKAIQSYKSAISTEDKICLSFLYLLDIRKQSVLCFPFPHSFDWSVQYFPRERLISFFHFF